MCCAHAVGSPVCGMCFPPFGYLLNPLLTWWLDVKYHQTPKEFKPC